MEMPGGAPRPTEAETLWEGKGKSDSGPVGLEVGG